MPRLACSRLPLGLPLAVVLLLLAQNGSVAKRILYCGTGTVASCSSSWSWWSEQYAVNATGFYLKDGRTGGVQTNVTTGTAQLHEACDGFVQQQADALLAAKMLVLVGSAAPPGPEDRETRLLELSSFSEREEGQQTDDPAAERFPHCAQPQFAGTMIGLDDSEVLHDSLAGIPMLIRVREIHEKGAVFPLSTGPLEPIGIGLIPFTHRHVQVHVPVRRMAVPSVSFLGAAPQLVRRQVAALLAAEAPRPFAAAAGTMEAPEETGFVFNTSPGPQAAAVVPAPTPAPDEHQALRAVVPWQLWHFRRLRAGLQSQGRRRRSRDASRTIPFPPPRRAREAPVPLLVVMWAPLGASCVSKQRRRRAPPAGRWTRRREYRNKDAEQRSAQGAAGAAPTPEAGAEVVPVAETEEVVGGWGGATWLRAAALGVALALVAVMTALCLA